MYRLKAGRPKPTFFPIPDQSTESVIWLTFSPNNVPKDFQSAFSIASLIFSAKSDIPFGIVVRDVNCSENEDENGDLFATVYVRGSFNGQSSLLDAGAIPAEDTSHKATPLSFEDFYVALRERGIIIRRNVN